MPENELTPLTLLGSIVALKAHPYRNEIRNIVFSGDPHLISPLMVIVEVVKENRNHFDESSGMQTSEVGTFQCRCIWYSQKSHQFEETWLSSRLLTIIQAGGQDGSQAEKMKKLGTKVIFKTAELESKKVQSAISYSDEKRSKKITALLPFVAPVMQVVGTARSDSKEPFLDTKTGERKRWISNVLIKCKYYNPSDKLSEVLVPVEALVLVAQVSDDVLLCIDNAKKGDKLLIVEFGIDGGKWTLIQPKNISSANGNYFFEGWDYLENKMREIDLRSISKVQSVDNNFPKLPNFEVTDATIIRHAVTMANIHTTLSKFKCEFLRIRYKDFEDRETTRTIKNWQFRNLADEDGAVDEYVHAFCLLRKDERTFKVSNIQSIEFLLPQELPQPAALNGQGMANQN